MIVILLRYLYLFKKLHNCSLGNTCILIQIISVEFAFMVSFHGESFSTARLAISKNGRMIAFDDLVNESIDAKPCIYVRLHVVWCEDLIKIVDLAPIDLGLHLL